MRIYHVGLAKRGRTLVIEARRSIDFLSCELYDYCGQHQTTKRQLRENRKHILAWAQGWKPDLYGNLRYAVVD